MKLDQLSKAWLRSLTRLPSEVMAMKANRKRAKKRKNSRARYRERIENMKVQQFLPTLRD